MQLFDSFGIDDVRRTGDGYMTAFAKVARTGVQEYRGSEIGMPDRDTIRVYRPPEEVFNSDAMHSFAHRPVTLKHPRTPVSAKNWKKFSGGQTGGEVVRDGQFVRVPLVLMDQKLIDAYMAGTKQLSMGYSCDIVLQDGITPEGEPYDAVQKDIRANHLALVPLARGGDQLRIGDDSDEYGSTGDSDEDWDWDKDKDEDEDEENLDDCYGTMKKDADGDDDDDDDDLDNEEDVNDDDDEVYDDDMSYDGLHRTLDRDFSTSERKKAAESGAAMPDGSFPIKSKGDLENAIRLVGKAKNPAAAKAHIKERAKALGATNMLPETWNDAAPDYVACPQCGANTSPDADECQGCGHIMMTRDHKGATMKTILLDGLTVALGDDQSASIVKRHFEKLDGKITKLKDSGEKVLAEVKTLQTQLADAQKTASAKDGEIAVLKKQLEDAKVTPEKLDVMVKARSAVIDAASPLVGKDFAFDAKSVEDIRRAAVSAQLGDAAKDMDDAAIGGAFAALTADHKRNNTGGSNPIRNVLRDAGPRLHTNVKDEREQAWNERNKKTQDAWRGQKTA